MTKEEWCPPTSSSSSDSGDGIKELAGDQIADAICNHGMQPILLTGMIRDELLHHFSSPNSIENPDLRQLLWRDSASTGILIESTHNWTPAMADKRPAILVGRNSVQAKGGLLLGNKSRLDEIGFQHYTKIWVGSHKVFCLHLNGTATEILATEVIRELGQFAPQLLRRFNLMKFDVMEYGPVSLVEESGQHFGVEITLAWAFVEQWMLEEQSRPTRGFRLSVLSEF